MRISGTNLADKKSLYKVKVAISEKFNFNIGFPMLVGISTELGSKVLMIKTRRTKRKIDDSEISYD